MTLELRPCAQCGQEFQPRTKHQRFHSTYCRIRFSRRTEGSLGWVLVGSEQSREQLRQQLAQAYLPIVLAIEELPTDSPGRRGAAQLAIEVIRETTEDIIERLMQNMGTSKQAWLSGPPRTGPIDIEPPEQ